MKMKNLVLLLLLISSVAIAQMSTTGVAFNSAITNVISGGSGGILWDDQFDTLATDIWYINCGARDNMGFATGTVTLSGGKVYMTGFQTTWGTPPDCVMISRPIYGDFTATAKSTMIPNTAYADPTTSQSGCGMMVSDIGLQYYSMLWKRYLNGAEQTYRYDSTWPYAGNASATSGADRWFRIQRQGTNLHFYDSSDGTTFYEKIASYPPGDVMGTAWHPNASSSVFLSLFVSEVDGTELSTGSFDFCTITRP